MMKPKDKKHSQESPKTRGFCCVFLSWRDCSNLSPLMLLKAPFGHISVPHQDFSGAPSQDWGNLIGSAHLPSFLSLFFFLYLSLSPSFPLSQSLFATYVFNIF